MKALVTGGGGFLGSRIAFLLRERGHAVTAFGRGRYPPLDAAGIPAIQGDVRDVAALRSACRGMDVVFHTAAITGLWGPPGPFWATNVDGTRNVVSACRERGVPFLVYTSSPSVVFGEEPLSGVDESQPYPNRYLATYPQTKAAAEQHVLSANAASLRTVALRPHLVWGPGDPHLIPRVIDRARRGKLVQVGRGDNLVDITFIDNAALAHVLAAEELAGAGRCAGRPYFISQGQPVRLWDWINGLLTQLSIRRVSRTISYATGRRVGAVLETVYRLLGLVGEPRMTRFLASQLALDHYFSIGAARRDFGYNPAVSTEEGTARLVRLLRSTNGGLPT